MEIGLAEGRLHLSAGRCLVMQAKLAGPSSSWCCSIPRASSPALEMPGASGAAQSVQRIRSVGRRTPALLVRAPWGGADASARRCAQAPLRLPRCRDLAGGAPDAVRSVIPRCGQQAREIDSPATSLPWSSNGHRRPCSAPPVPVLRCRACGRLPDDGEFALRS